MNAQPIRMHSQQTQNICIPFIQCWTNVEDVGPTLYKCYTNVLCLLGCLYCAVLVYVTTVLVGFEGDSAHYVYMWVRFVVQQASETVVQPQPNYGSVVHRVCWVGNCWHVYLMIVLVCM